MSLANAGIAKPLWVDRYSLPESDCQQGWRGLQPVMPFNAPVLRARIVVVCRIVCLGVNTTIRKILSHKRRGEERNGMMNMPIPFLHTRFFANARSGMKRIKIVIS